MAVETFVDGDVVIIKSSITSNGTFTGPKMTISKVHETDAQVYWYENGEVKNTRLPLIILKKANNSHSV
jgi:uncharacterized protein YodC (DUF2158 family)